MATIGITTNETSHANTISRHADDKLYHQFQSGNNLCGLYAINHVLQEGKCIFNDDKKFKQIDIINVTTNPPVSPATQPTIELNQGTIAEFRSLPNVYFNMVSLCFDRESHRPYNGNLSRFPCISYQYYDMRSLKYVVEYICGYVAPIFYLSFFIRPEISIPYVLSELLDSPGCLGAIINYGQFHFVAITVETKKCSTTHTRKFTYINSMAKTAICLDKNELVRFIRSRTDEIEGFMPVFWPVNGVAETDFYPCKTINNLQAAGILPRPIPSNINGIMTYDELDNQLNVLANWARDKLNNHVRNPNYNASIIDDIVNPRYEGWINIILQSTNVSYINKIKFKANCIVDLLAVFNHFVDDIPYDRLWFNFFRNTTGGEGIESLNIRNRMVSITEGTLNPNYINPFVVIPSGRVYYVPATPEAGVPAPKAFTGPPPRGPPPRGPPPPVITPQRRRLLKLYKKIVVDDTRSLDDLMKLQISELPESAIKKAVKTKRPNIDNTQIDNYSTADGNNNIAYEAFFPPSSTWTCEMCLSSNNPQSSEFCKTCSYTKNPPPPGPRRSYVPPTPPPGQKPSIVPPSGQKPSTVPPPPPGPKPSTVPPPPPGPKPSTVPPPPQPEPSFLNSLWSRSRSLIPNYEKLTPGQQKLLDVVTTGGKIIGASALAALLIKGLRKGGSYSRKNRRGNSRDRKTRRRNR